MLHYLFMLLAALATCGIYWGIPTVSLWWLLPIYLGFAVGITALYFIILICFWPFLSRDSKKRPNDLCRRIIVISLDWVMTVFRIEATLEGEELLPKEPIVLVSNHRSDFDPMVALPVFKDRKMVYISKESNFKIPLAGAYMRRAGFLAIDRENGMRALRTLKHAAEMMHEETMDIGIYPEGTRSKTGELLEFKTGAFYLAKKSNAPLVVMAAVGTEGVAKNCFRRKTHVRMRILEVIDPETVAKLSMDELAARTRETVARGIDDMQKR